MTIICTPCRDTVHAGFAFDLAKLLKREPLAEFGISQGSLLCNQRASLVKAVIASHASHLLFIDSDMRFPEDTLERLKAHNLPIVGANCKQRSADLSTTGVNSEAKTGLEEVDHIGFGVTLIRTEIFLKMLEPWFAMPFDGTQCIGEDIFFSRKAKEHGYQIFVDHDLSKEVGHIGTFEYKV